MHIRNNTKIVENRNGRVAREAYRSNPASGRFCNDRARAIEYSMHGRVVYFIVTYLLYDDGVGSSRALRQSFRSAPVLRKVQSVRQSNFTVVRKKKKKKLTTKCRKDVENKEEDGAPSGNHCTHG
jgi:hypothetical protein